jgi:hypothetical protein
VTRNFEENQEERLGLRFPTLQCFCSCDIVLKQATFLCKIEEGFGSKIRQEFNLNSRARDEVTGEWRKLHNKELCNLYSSLSIIKIIKSGRMKWAGHIARMGEKRNAYRLLVGKPEGKRPLGRLRRRWVYSIRMDLGEVGWGDVDWIGLAEDRNRWRALVNSVLILRVP